MTGRIQLALNVDDLDESIALLQQAVRRRAGQAPARLRQLRDRRPAAQARPDGEPRPGRQPQPPGRRGRRHRRGRRRADPPGRGRAWPRSTSATPPAATPGRTSSGCEGAPDGERWEIYTVLEDSPTFWGETRPRWQRRALDAGASLPAPPGRSAAVAGRPLTPTGRALTQMSRPGVPWPRSSKSPGPPRIVPLLGIGATRAGTACRQSCAELQSPGRRLPGGQLRIRRVRRQAAAIRSSAAGHEPVVDPGAAALAVDDPGLAQHLQVVADGGLGQVERRWSGRRRRPRRPDGRRSATPAAAGPGRRAP